MVKVSSKFVCVFTNIGGDMNLVISNKKIRASDFKKALKIYAKDNKMYDIDEIHNCDITDALEHGLTKLKYKVQVLDFDTANILYYVD